MKSLLVMAFIVLTSVQLNAQSIKIKVDGFKDTTVHLVRYFGKGMFYADTAEMKKGFVTFNGAKQQPGLFALLLPGANQSYFEFLYNNEEVHLETKFNDFIPSMVVKKSEENRKFFDYIRFLGDKKTKAGEITEKMSKMDKNSAEYKKYDEQLKTYGKEVKDYQLNLINSNPGMFVSKMVKLSMEVEIPDAPKNEKGEPIDSNFQYNYYKKHYFDNFDFKDDRLTNTTVFHNKLEYFMTKMIIQHWDTVLYYAYNLCDTLDPKSKTFEYCVSWITTHYGKSKIMGMDKVYTLMVDKYYCSKNKEGKSPAFWMTEPKLEELCEKIDVQRNLVLGAVAKNIILPDTTQTNFKDFYSLNAEYKILYFWSPTCGHCKTITPKIESLYSEKFKARNVEIFAVTKAIDDEFDKWKEFTNKHHLTFTNVALTDKLYKEAVEDARKVLHLTTLESLNYSQTYDIYSTPQVYVLDKNNKIVAKRLTVSQLEDFIDKMQGKADAPKLFPQDTEEEIESMH